MTLHMGQFISPSSLSWILPDTETTAHPPPAPSIAYAVGVTQGICRGLAFWMENFLDPFGGSLGSRAENSFAACIESRPWLQGG